MHCSAVIDRSFLARRFGSVTSSGVVPDGCPDGLPVNCFAPQVGLVNDSVWMTGGECDPAVIEGKKYWHYPTVTLFGRLTLLEETSPAKHDDDDHDDGTSKLQLFLLPHTHADVGWLSTPENLARLNVSRILNGVVGNLMNDTLKRRRFVWDEMYFLQYWWQNTATTLQQAQFHQLVQEKRIEFVDSGWSQHDMGCTTYDSMLNNWREGHLWIREKFGAAAAPRVGWSLDPFGISSSQAVLQSLMGFDAYFFTRVSDDVLAQAKANKTVEFVWRASSSLPDQETQILAHIFESYYCMPLPTYAFEWGPANGAAVPSSANIEHLALGLVNITKQRSAFFRSPNVLIPWGCDYDYQNAALVYNSTDWLIDVINAHSEEWGVVAQYTTATEYVAAIHRSDVVLPVKDDKQTFFPYNTWSG